MPEDQARQQRSGSGIVGIDLGITAAAKLSTGKSIVAPKPFKAALRRLRLRGRRISCKIIAAKIGLGLKGAIPKGTRLPMSNNRKKAVRVLARLHARIAAIRSDFTHNLTTRLCRENQTVVIENLHVKGMLANHKLARAITDIGFGRIRAQLEYKAKRYGVQVVVADRWFPSSQLCSSCGWQYKALALAERHWKCQSCGAQHDRDHNAAINLRGLATRAASNACGSSALPVHVEVDVGIVD